MRSGSLSRRGWEPGDAELEEATLAVQLLAELAPVRDLLQAGPQLQEAAYRLSTRWVGLDPVEIWTILLQSRL